VRLTHIHILNNDQTRTSTYWPANDSISDRQRFLLPNSRGCPRAAVQRKLADWPVTMQAETAAAPEQQAALRLLRRRSADRVSRPSSVGGDSNNGSASEGRFVPRS